MTRGWTLFVRLGAIVALGLFTVQLLLVLAVFLQRGRDAESGFRFPLPDQAAAMVVLFEGPEDRTLLLRALNGPDISVTVEPGPFERFAAEPRRLPDVERVLGRYLEALGPRRAAAFIAVPPEEAATLRRIDQGLRSRWPLRLAVELASGDVMVVESRGDLARRVFGWPLGLFSGFIALIVAAAALWAVRRETRPLRRLALAAEAFGRDGRPRELDAVGARELRALIAAFNRMQVRIGELLEGRALMLGAISHDLRTYLSRLRLRIEAIEPEPMRAAAERDVERISALLDDGLALARLGIEDVGDATTPLGPLLADLARERAGQGARLRLRPDPLPPAPVRGRPVALRRLFSNLIDNALKYGTRCDLTIEPGGDGVTVTVADDGPGVPEAERDRLLRPFQRAEEARTLGPGGTGLGLAVAREVALRSGGSLELAANEPHGLLCIVRLRVGGRAPP